MFEVELKLRAAHGPIRERLEAMDARNVGRVTQVDTYYNAPDRDFATTDEALRLREESDTGGQSAGERASEDSGESDTDAPVGDEGGTDERVLLTYKGSLVDDSSKTRTEAETRVVDGDAVRNILAGLGYDAAATVEKRRDRYAVADCRVTLDRVSGIGEFVEVEYHEPVVEGDIDGARGAVTDLVTALGLDPAASIQTSYLGLQLAAE